MAAGWFSEKGNLSLSFECSQDSRLERPLKPRQKLKKKECLDMTSLCCSPLSKPVFPAVFLVTKNSKPLRRSGKSGNVGR